MSITVLNDVIVSCTVVAAGVRGKNMRNNTRVTSFNGNTQVNVNWTRTLRQYELGVIPLFIDQWQQIEAMHEVTEGGAYGMLLRDPKDDEAVVTTGKLWALSGGVNVGTIGFGAEVGSPPTGVSTFNLYKRYAVTGTSRSKDRKITRPVATPLIYKDAVLVPNGTGSGQCTVNLDTGVVTFYGPAPAVGEALTWAGNFYVPVHFMDDSIDWSLANPGDYDDRLVAGPSVVLQEILE